MLNHPETYLHAIEIFQAGLHAVNPEVAIKAVCHLDEEILTVADYRYHLSRYEQILVLGAGKGGASMARAIEEILGARITTGMITVKYNHLKELKHIKIHQAGHPVPDQNGLTGARKIYQLAQSAAEKTLVICLISGGASALMPLPVAGISLQDKQQTTRALLACGATIQEINTIRKHLSILKGGGLARVIHPATLITLIISDVVGDDLNSIGSGPTVADPTSFADCREIVTKYSLQDEIPAAVLQHIESGIAGLAPETATAAENLFTKTRNIIVANNRNALLKAQERAIALGYHTLLPDALTEGDTRTVATHHLALTRKIQRNKQPLDKPVCILTGGETTVKLNGSGKGGRNQEFALVAALEMDGMEKITILCAGTDGSDGPTDAAGAFADETTVARAAAIGLDPQQYLERNDSYNFFDRLGDLYKTGPTNTNVMDLRIILLGQ